MGEEAKVGAGRGWNESRALAVCGELPRDTVCGELPRDTVCECVGIMVCIYITAAPAWGCSSICWLRGFENCADAAKRGGIQRTTKDQTDQ